MRRVKGRVSREIFEEFPHVKKRYWGRHFWARGYFYVTSGELTKDMIQEYLKHHFEKDPNDRFDIEYPAAKPAGIAGHSVRAIKPTSLQLVVV